MFFSDREHRLLLMAIGREQRFIADTKDLTDMLPECEEEIEEERYEPQW